MLSIGDVFHELLHEDWCVHGVSVLLGYNSAFVNQIVRVSNHTRHCGHDVLVHFVEFATLAQGHEQLAGLLLFSCENHTYCKILVK